MSVADELRKLQELRDAGVLTDEEFARTKAAILATIAPPPSAPTVDEKALRIRAQWEAFKASFSQIDEGTHGRRYQNELGASLEAAEDLLLTVCGEERYKSFVNMTENLARYHEGVRDARRDGDSDERRTYQDRYTTEMESLKRRIASIEYRI